MSRLKQGGHQAGSHLLFTRSTSACLFSPVLAVKVLSSLVLRALSPLLSYVPWPSSFTVSSFLPLQGVVPISTWVHSRFPQLSEKSPPLMPCPAPETPPPHSGQSQTSRKQRLLRPSPLPLSSCVPWIILGWMLSPPSRRNCSKVPSRVHVAKSSGPFSVCTSLSLSAVFEAAAHTLLRCSSVVASGTLCTGRVCLRRGEQDWPHVPHRPGCLSSLLHDLSLNMILFNFIILKPPNCITAKVPDQCLHRPAHHPARMSVAV